LRSSKRRADFAASVKTIPSGKHIRRRGRHRQSRFYLFALERLFEFGKNYDVSQQPRHE
jgi:hypothetical protein